MNKPTRCIDPVIKYCQGCKYGWVKYPDWVETYEDLYIIPSVDMKSLMWKEKFIL